MQTLNCPLCQGKNTEFYSEAPYGSFHTCLDCHLKFRVREALLSPEDERSRYEFHENSPNDIGYRKFLSQLLDPISKHLNPKMKGLDFGCGPGPTISVMLDEQNISCENYDPYFAKNPLLLDQTYDFVICTEAIEHFYEPHKEMSIIQDIVKKNGIIGFMTKFYEEKSCGPISKWHYINDDTHVSIFTFNTLEYLGNKFDWKILERNHQMVIFKKN